MRKSKLAAYCLGVLFVSSVSAQSAITSGGDSGSSGNYALSWSLGELSISTLTSSNYILTQGLHQGIYVEPIPLNTGVSSFNIEVFPNPAKEWIEIANRNSNSKWSYTILNQKGKAITAKGEILDAKHRVDLENIPSGLYFIQIKDQDQSQSFKLIINR